MKEEGKKCCQLCSRATSPGSRKKKSVTNNIINIEGVVIKICKGYDYLLDDN